MVVKREWWFDVNMKTKFTEYILQNWCSMTTTNIFIILAFLVVSSVHEKYSCINLSSSGTDESESITNLSKNGGGMPPCCHVLVENHDYGTWQCTFHPIKLIWLICSTKMIWKGQKLKVVSFIEEFLFIRYQKRTSQQNDPIFTISVLFLLNW